jgi:hypothetical protein
MLRRLRRSVKVATVVACGRNGQNLARLSR